MFAASMQGAGAVERPSLARSVWTDLGGGVWRCNPVLTGETVPELRRADHARRRLAALTVRVVSRTEADRVEDSFGADVPPVEPAGSGVGGLDGVAVAALVEDAAADPRGVEDDATLTDRIIDAERLARFAAGARAGLVAEFARRRPGDESTLVCSDRIELGSRWAPDELGLALDLTRLGATALIGQSVQLVTVLPDTLAALRNGEIDERRVDAICTATLRLPVELARRVEAIVLPAAPGRTVRQVRERLYRAVHRVDPDGEYRRHKEACSDRRVSVQAREEGMAAMWLFGPGVEVEASFTMLTRLAESLGAVDPRTKDQRRFDLAVQTMQGRLTVTDLADLADVADVATTVATGVATAPSGEETGSEADTGAEPGAERGTGSETAGSETAGSETAGSETAGSETAGSETAGSETAGSETAGSETAGSETGGAGQGQPDERADPEPDDPEPGDPADLGPPDRGPAGPGSGGPGSALLEAVVAALALRPQIHDTVHKPLIHVVIGLDTLIGADDHPADLIGHGPNTATTARALAADGVWKRLVTDPVTGNLLNHGRTTYKPPTPLAEHIDARDQYCRFPTCTRRARDSDQDHLLRFEHHGTTAEDNLNALCPVHHLLKEHRDWNVLAHPDGTLTWITPTGHRYTSTPYDYRPYTDPATSHDTRTTSDTTTTGDPNAGPSRNTPTEDPESPPPF